MFFNRRATIRCVLDSLTPNRLGCSTTGIHPDRALKFSQSRSIGCEISRKANLTSQWAAREKFMSPDVSGFIASEEDESSSEIILQTETTGLGPIQIFSYSSRTGPRFGDRQMMRNWFYVKRIQYLNRP